MVSLEGGYKTIDISSSIFQPLEDAIHHQFIPALPGQVSSSPEVRKLLSLPTCLGGLNIVYRVDIAESQLKVLKDDYYTTEDDH